MLLVAACSSEGGVGLPGARDASGTDGAIPDASVPDAGHADASATDAGMADTDPADSATRPTCDGFRDLAGFVAVARKAKTKHDDGYGVQRIFFTGGDDRSTYGTYSIIKIVAYEGLVAYPATAGSTIALSQVGFNDRDGFVVKHGIDCDDRGRDCQTWLLAYDGLATVTGIDWAVPVGSVFSGSLTDVLFREVTFDGSELPTPVPGGCAFTLSTFSWSEGVTVASGGG